MYVILFSALKMVGMEFGWSKQIYITDLAQLSRISLEEIFLEDSYILL